MTRTLLWALNAPFLVLLTLIGIGIQTSLFHPYPLLYLQPDVTLLIVVWCALRRGILEGGILTIILSNAVEIHSSSPQGYYFVSYMAVFFGIRILSRYLLIPRLTTLVALTMFTMVTWRLIGLGFMYSMGLAAAQWRHTLALIPFGAAMEGLLAIWVYRWLEKLDFVTFKDPRARQVMEDELLMNDEWL